MVSGRCDGALRGRERGECGGGCWAAHKNKVKARGLNEVYLIKGAPPRKHGGAGTIDCPLRFYIDVIGQLYKFFCVAVFLHGSCCMHDQLWRLLLYLEQSTVLAPRPSFAVFAARCRAWSGLRRRECAESELIRHASPTLSLLKALSPAESIAQLPHPACHELERIHRQRSLTWTSKAAPHYAFMDIRRFPQRRPAALLLGLISMSQKGKARAN